MKRYEFANLREGKVQPCCFVRITKDGNKAIYFGPDAVPITALTPQGLNAEIRHWRGIGYAVFDEIEFHKAMKNGFITEVFITEIEEKNE